MYQPASPNNSVASTKRTRGRLRTTGARPVKSTTLFWQQLVLTAMVQAASRVQSMSRPKAMRFGDGLGKIAYRCAGRQRQRAQRNLQLAYGDAMTERERDTLTRRVFQHFGKCVVDFLRAPKTTNEEVDALVRCEGWENIEAAMQAGKGVILVTGHFGNWEIMGRWLATVKNLPLTVVAKEPKNPAFASYMRTMREGAGYTVLNQGESARDLVRVLKKGEAILLLPDQNSGDMFVPFFNVPAGTVAGPATISLRFNIPLIPICCVRENDDTYRVICLPPLPIEATTGDRDLDTARLMTQVNAALETMIRRAPEQWLWLHNRWKSAFEPANRSRWPEGFDYPAACARRSEP